MKSQGVTPDGVHAMAPAEQMSEGARKLRAAYAITPGGPLYQREFGFMEGTVARWQQEGMPQDVPRDRLFGYDPPGEHALGDLGGCEAAFVPAFEEKQVEDRGEYEVVQDSAGRHVLCFKGRRDGFMPEYLDHPVKDRRTWEEDVAWRMDPNTPARYADLERKMAAAKASAAQGLVTTQYIVGGYMYLRSLMGPTGVLLAFHDQPEVIHVCMRAWFALADAVTARHQQHVTFDQVCLDEDICYNKGPLISPETIQEFLFPYYQQLLSNIASRQLDRKRHLYVHVDTDGRATAVLELYRQGMGLNVMSPFEVASGCDVVEVGRNHPDLIMCGGIDKRVLAGSREGIDAFLKRVVPPMRARGGYIPTCDHAVPAEVPYRNYLHYRERMAELGE